MKLSVKDKNFWVSIAALVVAAVTALAGQETIAGWSLVIAYIAWLSQ